MSHRLCCSTPFVSAMPQCGTVLMAFYARAMASAVLRERPCCYQAVWAAGKLGAVAGSCRYGPLSAYARAMRCP
eukprot:1192747-Rhodomonas_salina.1